MDNSLSNEDGQTQTLGEKASTAQFEANAIDSLKGSFYFPSLLDDQYAEALFEKVLMIDKIRKKNTKKPLMNNYSHLYLSETMIIYCYINIFYLFFEYYLPVPNSKGLL